MKINIDYPYRERKGIAQELRAYITILKIAAITLIILLGIHAINQLDDIMTQQADLTYQVIVLQQEVDGLKVDEADPPEAISLGEYTITHYCPESCCCGKWANGYTATGTKATEGRTIAVDPKIIPYGTTVIIDGHEYIAEDCGGAIKGNKIDIFVSSHSEAINRGTFKREVHIYEGL